MLSVYDVLNSRVCNLHFTSFVEWCLALSNASNAAAIMYVCVQTIVLFHHSIRGAMEVFASEAAALQQQPGVSAYQLAGLVERHRLVPASQVA